MTAKVFSAPKLKEVSITIGDVPYVLREMTGTTREAYQTQLSSLARVNDKGVTTGLRSFEGLHSGLISRCLFDQNGVSVSAKTVGEWPATLVEALYDECRDLNNMLTPEERAKKEGAIAGNPSGESGSAGSE